MTQLPLSRTRRSLLAVSATALALALPVGAGVAQAQTAAAVGAVAEDTAIRPFRIAVPEAALVDLRHRIAATRWPDRELVADQSQGVKLDKIEDLVRYWGTDYDWR